MKTQHAAQPQYIETVDLVRRYKQAQQRARRVRMSSPHARCLERILSWIEKELALRAASAERSLS